MESSKRTLLAIIISAIVLIGFNYFVPKPPHQEPSHTSVAQQTSSSTTSVSAPLEGKGNPHQSDAVASLPDRRLPIIGRDIKGTLNLRGARLDDLVLTQYRETLAKDSPLVRLLDRAESEHPSYLVIGWQNTPGYVTRLPDDTTVWDSDLPQHN